MGVKRRGCLEQVSGLRNTCFLGNVWNPGRGLVGPWGDNDAVTKVCRV